MNPSTEDIVKAIEAVGAERVLILPNNKNIIMAAEQAAEVLGIEAAVVPTKTLPQGMAAILAFNAQATVEENKKKMTEAYAHVKTGQVTFAVRDTSIDGVEIKKDDFMALAEGKIILSTPSREEAATKLAQSLIDENAEIVTIIYGEDVSDEEASNFAAFIEEQFEDAEIELYNGKQPLYPYILSVE
jgi:dihydroxyacetone kinase-like predicted kinase